MEAKGPGETLWPDDPQNFYLQVFGEAILRDSLDKGMDTYFVVTDIERYIGKVLRHGGQLHSKGIIQGPRDIAAVCTDCYDELFILIELLE